MTPGCCTEFPEPTDRDGCHLPIRRGCLPSQPDERAEALEPGPATSEDGGENESTATGSDDATRGATPDRRLYSSPRLITITVCQDLLEVLGPAQANYGGAFS
jgi:hypothetical protein